MADVTGPKVVVAGDVTMDWNLVHEASTGAGRPWDPSAASALSRRPGGAALIAELLSGIAKRTAADGSQWSVVAPVAPGLATSPTSPRVHHSFVLWTPQEGPADRPPWRVAQFLGFDRRRSEPDRPLSHGRPAADDPAAEIVVLSDAGLGFSRQPDLWPSAIRESGREPWVVLRSAPVDLEASPWDDSPLLAQLLENHARRTIVVVDIGDLRDRDIQISRGVSWERTAIDLLEAVSRHECLSVFGGCAQVIVSLGTSGAFGYGGAGSTRDAQLETDSSGPSSWLVFDPAGLEGSFEARQAGRVVGLGTCLAAGVVHDLMRGCRPGPFGEGLEVGARGGVDAARRLHAGGYRVVRSDRRPLSLRFPVSAVAEALGGPDGRGSDLVTVDMPASAAQLERPSCEGRVRPPPWTILEARHGQGVRGIASRIVRSGLEAVIADVPRLQFGGLVTVDRREIEAYGAVAGRMLRYSEEPHPSRPLSIAVFGPPGSGKSFGIKQIAKVIAPGRIEPIEFNLSQFAGPSGLIDALHQVRDVGISGKLPLVFWDEFDTDLDGRYGWLRYFLAPMWDGAFQHGQVTHAVGRAIFIFAGGTKSSYREFVAHEGVNDEEWGSAKGPDFASRLGGYLDVLGPNSLGDPSADIYEPDPYHVIRRAIILRSLLERGHPKLFAVAARGGCGELSIDDGVLRALLNVSAYHHGARSMEAVLSGSALAERRHFDRSCLPLATQLEMHVSSHEFESLIERWEPDGALLTAMATTNHELFCERLRADGFRYGPKTDEKDRTHSSLVEWEELPPDEREQNRDFVRSIADKLAAIGYRLVRTGASGAESAIDPGVLDDVVEALAEQEHDRWVELKLDGGWSWGESTDKRHRIHKDLLPWEYVSEEALEARWGKARAACIGKTSLPGTDKDKDRDLVRSIPTILERHGFAIVPAEPTGR